MSSQEMLARLAERCGILPLYYDVWGEACWCKEATKRALLKAMGMPVDGEDGSFLALKAIEALEAPGLPPVHVAEEGASVVEVPAWLPCGVFRLPWRLREENGTGQAGVFQCFQCQGPDRHWRGKPYFPTLLSIPCPPVGYHRLEVEGLDRGEQGNLRLIVAPKRCYRPESLERAWGVAVQLYSLRSRRNWGLGDFTDLLELVRWAGLAGARLVGLNPLHALFPQRPDEISPYSPSSRQFFNVLYLDVEAIEEFQACSEARRLVQSEAFQSRLARLRETPQVDYRSVAELKMALLERVFRQFWSQGSDTPRRRDFTAYRCERGQALRDWSLFQALDEHFHGKDWHSWPPGFKEARSPAVAAFAEKHPERLAFWAYLQWQAECQLEAVRTLGLELGVALYGDLAVGVSGGGADVWGDPALYARKASVGAPPDAFNPKGQNWGLPPFIPHRLAEAGFEPFIAMLRSNMRHMGALRLDHVMGLMRLYWVNLEDGGGAYVRYPMKELLGILALESQRNRCLIVGEDLGTVPDEVRAAMDERGILSYHPLYFEQIGSAGERQFKAAADYPADALVCVSTHDLPTLKGFWNGHDLVMRHRLGFFKDDASYDEQCRERAEDRIHLGSLLDAEGLEQAEEIRWEDLAAAVHRFLAKTPARLMMVQPEDVFGLLDQMNLPGTTESQAPNWRRKLPVDLEAWPDNPHWTRILDAIKSRVKIS